MLGDAKGTTRVAPQSRDGNASAAVLVLRCSQENDAPSQALHDEGLAAFDAHRVVGQVIAEVPDADPDCHAPTLRR